MAFDEMTAIAMREAAALQRRVSQLEQALEKIKSMSDGTVSVSPAKMHLRLIHAAAAEGLAASGVQEAPRG
jgi:hypothetical protein